MNRKRHGKRPRAYHNASERVPDAPKSALARFAVCIVRFSRWTAQSRFVFSEGSQPLRALEQR